MRRHHIYTRMQYKVFMLLVSEHISEHSTYLVPGTGTYCYPGRVYALRRLRASLDPLQRAKMSVVGLILTRQGLFIRRILVSV